MLNIDTEMAFKTPILHYNKSQIRTNSGGENKKYISKQEVKWN